MLGFFLILLMFFVFWAIAKIQESSTIARHGNPENLSEDKEEYEETSADAMYTYEHADWGSLYEGNSH